MHIDVKLVGFIKALMARGAEVFVIGCNRNTTQDDCVAVLKSAGAEAYAWRDMPEEEYQAGIQKAVEWGPTHLCEMGADISNALHSSPAMEPARKKVVAALEATGSGITKLQGLDLSYPVFNWDDVVVKECLHNRYMVGLSTWVTFMTRTNLSLHEKTVVVVGYGLVGQGLADAAKAFGGCVVVVERDPGRIIPARFAGWRTSSDLSPSLLAEADVIVTATGASNVVGAPHLAHLKHQCFLLNVGHRASEIDVSAIYAAGPRRVVRPYITEVTLAGGREIYVVSDGSMANLAAGTGDSINAFDTVVAVMLGGVRHITAGKGPESAAGVHLLPQEAWADFM